MEEQPCVRDLMDDIFEYPHMPYWFTLRQAMDIMRKMTGPQHGSIEPPTIFIFDEKYNLLGLLDMKAVLRGCSGDVCPDGGNADKDSSESPLERPVSGFMVPVECFLDTGDDIMVVAELMLSHGLSHLPVLEGKRKLVGIVRMTKVFGHVTDKLLK